MRVLIIGATGGIGRAMAQEAAARGAEVLGLSRSHDGLDLTDEASIAASLGKLTGTFERILVTTGALEIDGRGPEKSLRALSADGLFAQFGLNAIGPALVMKHSARLLPRDRPAVPSAIAAQNIWNVLDGLSPADTGGFFDWTGDSAPW